MSVRVLAEWHRGRPISAITKGCCWQDVRCAQVYLLSVLVMWALDRRPKGRLAGLFFIDSTAVPTASSAPSPGSAVHPDAFQGCGARPAAPPFDHSI